jgi:UDP-glucose 4-epimerase
MANIVVTGAAGFVGSHLCDLLLKQGHSVTGFDNLSTGFIKNLGNALGNENFRFAEGDILDAHKLGDLFNGVEFVYHMAANADIRGGLDDPSRDLNQNIIGTYNVLEAIRSNGVGRIVFASSAAVLGEPTQFPTPEDCAIPIQTSLYGASKMSCEGLISAYCEGYGLEGYIFRFVSLLGPRYPHGHVIDFVRQLLNNQSRLEILGDGTQQKSYLHIDDCIAAIDKVVADRTAAESKHRVQIYNLGTDHYIQVAESVNFITDAMQLSPEIIYGTDRQGWIGDNPFVFLDTEKIRKAGWQPEHDIETSIRETVRWLLKNKWIL